MAKLYLDTETRSAVNLNKHGVKRYVRCPRFKVMLVSWAVEEEPPRLWKPIFGEPIPERLKHHLEDADTALVIANSQFDRRVMAHSEDFGFINVPTTRIVDTMVQGLAHNLPGGLEDQSKLFGLGSEAKLDGRALIRLFCAPNFRTGEFAKPEDHPEEWEEFCKYAKQDITSMRAIHKRIPRMNYPRQEHDLWVLDQKINDRGLPVDVELAEAAMKEQEEEKVRLNEQTFENTGGDVEAATQVSRIITHISDRYGYELPNLQAATVERWLNFPDLPPDLRTLLSLRAQSGLTAATKYKTVLERQIDGRLHDTLQFLGASVTGRDSGRAFQPQNLMRPTRWGNLTGSEIDKAIESDIAMIKAGAASFLDANVMDLLGNCIRSVIAAPKGKKLVVADLSNIEGRSLVWLAGEEWKLKFFREFDEGLVKYDNYVMAYAEALNVKPEEVTYYQRQIGKVMELALGYGGGVAAFLGFVNVYRMDIKALTKSVWEIADVAMINEASDKYSWAKENGYHADMDKETYSACEYLKTAWRRAHPETVSMWGELEGAFRNCIEHNKTPFSVGKHLTFKRHNDWLFIRLPSGRFLTYLQPRIEKDGSLTYVGRDGYSKKIQRIQTYSGKLAENVASAAARDILLKRMPDVEEAGFEIICRVHDEFITTAPDEPEYSAGLLSDIMTLPYEWSEGLPLAADGFEAYRYRKDD